MSKELNVFFGMCIKDLIGMIKFIGQQHAFLTDITDQLNICYAFQVWNSVISFDSNFQ